MFTRTKSRSSEITDGERLVIAGLLGAEMLDVGDQDPNPDPSDPYVLGPPESGYGSFYQAKLVRKP